MKKFEIILKNLFLKILLLFNSAGRKTPAFSNSKYSRILVIRLNRIGDALAITPFIKELKNGTGAEIHVLADRKNSFAFSNNHYINKVIVFEKGLKGFFRTVRLLNNNKYDAVVDLHDDISTTVSFLLALLNVPRKYGLKKGNENLYTNTIDRLEPSTHHVIDRSLELLKLFSIKPGQEGINVVYAPSTAGIKKAEEFIHHNFKSGKYLFGINISAGSDARFWGVDRFKKLISFLESYDIEIMILSPIRDLHLAEQIAEGRPVFASPDFDEFCAAISKLDFLFTPDTSAVHIASAFNIPVFGLYVKYNTNDMIWSPYKSKFDCIITTEPNLNTVSFEETIAKFKPFFESVLPYEQRNSIL
jgi:ADP-heptose:LPS heptosyltransferase